jgi:hypothetical protein
MPIHKHYRGKNIEQVHATMLDFGWMTIAAVAYHLHNSHGFPHGIIQDEPGFHKVSVRLVPKQLTGEHKCNRLKNPPRSTEPLT